MDIFSLFPVPFLSGGCALFFMVEPSSDGGVLTITSLVVAPSGRVLRAFCADRYPNFAEAIPEAIAEAISEVNFLEAKLLEVFCYTLKHAQRIYY